MIFDIDSIHFEFDPYDEGRTAFRNREHYNANPFTIETLSGDEWDRGWGDEERKWPGVFDHATEQFLC